MKIKPLRKIKISHLHTPSAEQASVGRSVGSTNHLGWDSASLTGNISIFARKFAGRSHRERERKRERERERERGRVSERVSERGRECMSECVGG